MTASGETPPANAGFGPPFGIGPNSGAQGQAVGELGDVEGAAQVLGRGRAG